MRLCSRENNSLYKSVYFLFWAHFPPSMKRRVGWPNRCWYQSMWNGCSSWRRERQVFQDVGWRQTIFCGDFELG